MNETRFAYSVTELSRRMGVSRPTIYAEIHAGRLPVLKLGRRTLIPVEAIREWIARQTEGGAEA